MSVRLFFLAFASILATAQPPKPFALTIDNIMRGPELYGYEPRAVRWSGDSQRIYFQWKQASDGFRKDFDTWVVNRDGSDLKRLTRQEARLAPPVDADFNSARTAAVYSLDGDLLLYDFSTGKCRQLTKTADVESSPRFTPDAKRITFLRGGNLYVMPVDGGMIEQLTDIQSAASGPALAAPVAATGTTMGRRGGGPPPQAATSGEERRGTDSQEYLKKEERDLIESVRERARKREEDEARTKQENPRKPFRLAARQNVTSLQLSGDGKYVVALVTESTEGSKNAIVPNYVTESAYTEDIGSRSKVGDVQSRSRLATIRVDSGEVKWIEHGIQEPAPQPKKPATPAPATPAPATPAPAAPPAPPDKPKAPSMQERPIHLSAPIWNSDGTHAVVQGRAANNKDRWIFALDAEAGKLRALIDLHDDAWIGGPAGFTLGWMADDTTVYFVSERDGYAHLYTVPFAGGEPSQLTRGKWEVTGVRLSRDRTKFYLTTSEVSPFERQVYLLDWRAATGERTRLTAMPGGNDAVPSPDEKYLAVISSYTTRPPELFVQPNQPGAESHKLTSSPAPEFWTYSWHDTPIVKIPARDGAELPAQLFKPANWTPGGPAVVFIHGAGYTQNVHKWWSSYSHEYMFHHLLMERGYMVLNVDYRASAGYGRDWRTAVYRKMGGKDLDDEVDAARWLVSAQGVDARRIGVYGGSYGGFLTLMAMFTQPDVFAAGAALRPVTDWAHYNHQYTSAILNSPQNDSDAYRFSSPIYHAAGLKGALLICHGIVDTNVHFQDTVRLVQRLIELKKENWELAVFPVEDHTFQEPASWADEYKRILKLFETNLKRAPVAGEKATGGAARRRREAGPRTN